MPGLTPEDARRVIKLYGELVHSVQGKETWKMAAKAKYDDGLLLTEKKRVLHADVMHSKGKQFLISVSVPLFLIMQYIFE